MTVKGSVSYIPAISLFAGIWLLLMWLESSLFSTLCTVYLQMDLIWVSENAISWAIFTSSAQIIILCGKLSGYSKGSSTVYL